MQACDRYEADGTVDGTLWGRERGRGRGEGRGIGETTRAAPSAMTSGQHARPTPTESGPSITGGVKSGAPNGTARR